MKPPAQKTPFALTAKSLLGAATTPLGESDEEKFAWWAAFADRVGPALLPFLARPESYAKAPLEELGLATTPLRSLTPRRDEMWVLFCFRPGALADALHDSPLRSDGFPLILEWRSASEDSPLISSALRTLAARVRQQLGFDGWGLHPAFGRYGDQIDFTEASLFSDGDHVDSVASAWGALAAGLLCAATGRFPPEWPFPSIQWDEKRGCMAGVAGLAQKLSVVADCGAAALSVARTQRREACGLLADARLGDEAQRFARMRIHAVRDRHGPREAAEEIAFGIANDRRLRRRISIAVLTPLLVLLSGWGLYSWDAQRAFSKYYAAISYHYGLPSGLYEVTPDAQRKRDMTFRFDYEGVHDGTSIHAPWQLKTLFGRARRLVRVVCVNARNVPRLFEGEGFDNVPIIQEFRYADDGRLETVLCRRRGGDDFVSGLVEKQQSYDNYDGTPNGHVVFRSGDGKEYYYGEVSLSHVDAFLPQEGRSEIFEHVLVRDAEGRVTRREFRNRLDPVGDGDGVGGIAYEYNRDGLVSQRTNLDIGGTNGVPNRRGVVYTSLQWDGPLLKHSCAYDAARRPVADRIGVMHYAYEHDANGNVTSFRFLDGEGRPTYNLQTHEWKNRIAECRFAWTNGMALSRLYLGTPGNEKDISLADDNMPGMRWRRTPLGDICAETFLDAGGEPTTNVWGIGTSRFTIDDRTGKVLYAASYGIDGVTPVCDGRDGTWAYSNVLDRAGNYVLLQNFDTDGRLSTNRFGTAITHTEYDRLGHTTYQLHLDANGKPSMSGIFTAIEISYRHGRDEEWRYCAGDAARTSSINWQGVSREVKQYDEAGRLVRRIFHALPGTGNSIRPGKRGPDCARYEILYDGCGNMAGFKHYDAEGRLLPMPNKPYAYAIFDYDLRGRTVSISYYDVADRPVAMGTNEACRVENRYDGVDNSVSERTFIAPSNTVCALWGHHGVSRIVLRYAKDKSHGIVGRRYYDAAGNELPTRTVIGVNGLAPEGMAKRLGILTGDVLCICEGYRVHEGTSQKEIVPFLAAAAKKPAKQLVVARNSPDGYQIRTFQFPEGKFGIWFSEKQIPEAEFRQILSELK